MATWPVVTDDDGTGLIGTIYNKALTDAIKAYIDAGDGVGGAVDWSAVATSVSIKDNEAAALDFKEGTNSYLKFVTTNDGEKLVFGKRIEVAGTAILPANEQAIYVNCPSETVATNGIWVTLKSTVTSGDLTGVRSRVYGNAASAGANVRGGYFEAKMEAGKYVARLEGLLAHADYSAGSITVSGAVIGLSVWIGQGTGLNAANLYGELINIQTRGNETITSDDIGLMIRNEAVGGNGRTMDAAIRITDLNMGGGTDGFTYGIDLNGVGITTGDIRFSGGQVISSTGSALTIPAFTLGGKLTAGSSEIEGSNFDINGGTIGSVTLDGAIAGGDQAFTDVGDMTFHAASIIKSGGTNTNTLLLAADDTSFITLTTGATDTCAISGAAIDSCVIGAGTAAAGTFVALTATGAISFDGGAFTFNTSEADLDVRFAASSITNALYIDGATGKVFINETANTEADGPSLTISGDESDGEYICLKDKTEVAHDMTARTETDTWGIIKKLTDAGGGMGFWGYAEANQAFKLYGGVTTNNTDKNANALAPIAMVAHIKTGNTTQDMQANDNIFLVGKGIGAGDTVFLVDTEGDLFADGGVGSTNMVTLYDEFEDAHLVRAFDIARAERGGKPIRDNWSKFIKYNEKKLVDLGILGDTLENGGLTNVTRLQQLHNGAIWQNYTAIKDHDKKHASYERAFEKISQKLGIPKMELLALGN